MPSSSSPLVFRSPTPQDSTHLAFLADTATRGLTSFLWSGRADPGQSAFDVGRDIIRNDEAHFTHFKNWRVAEHRQEFAGALSGYVIEEASGNVSSSPDVVRPLNELKALASGTWYLSALALFPEYRRKGFGRALLAEAKSVAQAVGSTRMTLLVGSFNPTAHELYLKAGFTEWHRRPFFPFPGSDDPGEWILMATNL